MSEQTTTAAAKRKHWSGYKHGGNRPVIKTSGKPDEMMAKAKKLVVDNYNAHHNKEKTPPLEESQVNIVFFTMVGEDFSAIVEGTVVHGVLYHVEHIARTSSSTVTVFKRVKFARIPE